MDYLLAERLQSTLFQLYGDDAPANPKLTLTTSHCDFCDYKCCAALKLSRNLFNNGNQVSSLDVANTIVNALNTDAVISDCCEPATVAGPGFVNLTMKDSFVASKKFHSEFQGLYSRLGDIQVIERGESFYNSFLNSLVDKLREENLLVDHEGSVTVIVEGIPQVIRKYNGVFLYLAMELAAIQYRVNEDKADRIIYVTDDGQSLHFRQVFSIANQVELIPENVKVEHAAFGKSFKSAQVVVPSTSELLDRSKAGVRTELDRRAAADGIIRTEEEVDRLSDAIGVAAMKYSLLKHNRKNDYKFKIEHIANLEGNTAPYFMYCFARAQSIYRTESAGVMEASANDGESNSDVRFVFVEKEERALAKHLMRLSDTIYCLEKDLLPHALCDCTLKLTKKFNQFYEKCPVLNADTEELKHSRLGLCQISVDGLQLCLGFLGIPTLNDIYCYRWRHNIP